MSSSIDFDDREVWSDLESDLEWSSGEDESETGEGIYSGSAEPRPYVFPANALFRRVPLDEVSVTPQSQYLVGRYNASSIIAAWGGGISGRSQESLSEFVLSRYSMRVDFDNTEFTGVEKAKRIAIKCYILEDWYRNIQNLLRGDPITPNDIDSKFLIAVAILFKVAIQERYKPDPKNPIDLKRVIQLSPVVLKQWQQAALREECVVMFSPFSFGNYVEGAWPFSGNVELRLVGLGVCPRLTEHIYPPGQYMLIDAGNSRGQQTFHVSLSSTELENKPYQYMLNQAYLYFLDKYSALYDEGYRNPMRHRGYIDQRPNHNMAHAIRKMFNVVRVIKLFSKFAKNPDLRLFCENLLKNPDNIAGSESKELVLIKVLALAGSTGRMDELSRSQDPMRYQLAKIKAGDIVAEFLKQFRGLLSDEQIAQYQQLIEHVCNPAYKGLTGISEELECIWLILSFAHDADLRRCYSAREYEAATFDKYVVELEDSDAAKTALEVMLREAVQAVKLTGMGLGGEDMIADPDKFMLCAKFPNICITVLSERPDLVLLKTWRDILSSGHPVSAFHEAYKNAAYYTGLEARVFQHRDNLLLLGEEDKLALSAQQFELDGTHFLKVLNIVEYTLLDGIYEFCRQDEKFQTYLKSAMAMGFVMTKHDSYLIPFYLNSPWVFNALLEVENLSEPSRKSWLNLFSADFSGKHANAKLIDLSTNRVFKIELAKKIFLSDAIGLSRLIKYVARTEDLDYVALESFLEVLLPLYKDYDASSIDVVKNLAVLVWAARGNLAITTEVARVINSAFETDQRGDLRVDMFSGYSTKRISFDPDINWQYVHDHCPAFMQFMLSKVKLHQVLPSIKLDAKYVCSSIREMLTVFSEEEFNVAIGKFKIAPFYLLPEHFTPHGYKGFSGFKKQFVSQCFRLPDALAQFCKAIQKIKMAGGNYSNRVNYYKFFVDTLHSEVVPELNKYQEALMLAYRKVCFSTPNTTSDTHPIQYVANGLIGDAEGVRTYLLNPTEFGGRGRVDAFKEKNPKVFDLLTSDECSSDVVATVFSGVAAAAGAVAAAGAGVAQKVTTSP